MLSCWSPAVWPARVQFAMPSVPSIDARTRVTPLERG
jgi:hypothetical protein